VCCSVLQCVAVSVLNCVAVRCSASQCVAVCRSVSQRVAVYCRMLQCFAAYYSVLQNVVLLKEVIKQVHKRVNNEKPDDKLQRTATQCNTFNTLQHTATHHTTLQHSESTTRNPTKNLICAWDKERYRGFPQKSH